VSSIHKRDDGRPGWRLRWREGGRNRSKSFRTKEAAKKFERTLDDRLVFGVHAPAAPSTMTVLEHLRDWWQRDGLNWALNTKDRRASVQDRWLVPYLGDVRLADLGTEAVEEWRAVIVADGCPRTQANHALSVLLAALTAARRWRRLPANPCQDVQPLRVRKPRRQARTPAQVEALRAAMPTARDALIVSLLAYAGLRPQELQALTWGRVSGRTITVSEAVGMGVIDETKTRTWRTVDVIAPLARDLTAYRPRVVADDELVVAGERGGILDIHNWRTRVWKPACEAAGLPATVPYEMRHTFASLLIHEGRSAPYVAAVMGHSRTSTAQDHYGHWFDSRDMRTGVPMEEAVEEARAALEQRGVLSALATASRMLRRRLA
jgi:integrase